MTGQTFSLILLPTLACNAACRYCFEHKSGATLDLGALAAILDKTLDYLDEQQIRTLLIYWQGGEVMTLPAAWFEKAQAMIEEAATRRNKEIRNFIQSNMIGYTREWGRILRSMFNGSVGTSLDYPNLHRIAPGATPAAFNRLWRQKVSEARAAGIQVGVISIPNQATFKLGAERFYTHFVDELQITDFQVNLPFPGGPGNDSGLGYPLAAGPLSQFLAELFDVWLARGHDRGVSIGPFDRFLEYCLEGGAELPCIWRDNCSNEFLCIDPNGNVAQCDCWAASYPEHWFGNIFQPGSLGDLLKRSTARQAFRKRPAAVIQREDCLECEYLSLCHGGCPVRAYSVYGAMERKDPYCEVYQAVFRRVADAAATLARRRSQRPPGHAHLPVESSPDR
jgi:radical SAM protein with 4Fe4S-binding SPASM domain